MLLLVDAGVNLLFDFSNSLQSYKMLLVRQARPVCFGGQTLCAKLDPFVVALRS